jgi:hypothetical protein
MASRRSGSGSLALSGLLVVAVVAAVGCSVGGPTASQITSSAASASATAGSSAAVSGSPMETAGSDAAATFTTTGAAPDSAWSSITWRKLPADSPILSVAAVFRWHGGYVAYGDKGIWASTDGRTWIQAASGSPAGPIVVLETALGLVALVVAEASCPTVARPCFPSSAGPVEAWTSSDGMKWTDRGPANGISGTQLIAAAGSPIGAVAETQSDSVGPVVRFSTDGVTWAGENVPGISPMFPCEGASFGLGRYVLMCPADKETDAGDLPTQPVWSSDGVHWFDGTAPTATYRPAGIDTILAGRSGFMATGYVPGEAGAAEWWHSADGSLWQVVQGYSPVGSYTTTGAIPGGTYPNGWLCGDGHRLVALSLDSSHASLSGAGWTSADGKSWSKFTGQASIDANQFSEVLFPTGVLAAGWWGAAA